MNLVKTFLCIIACYLCTVSSGVAAGKEKGSGRLLCWTNQDGVKECGDKIPPEYSQQGHEERNKQGTVVKETERAKTGEELAEEKKQADAAAEADRVAKETARKDKILLDTYTSVDDIALARDSKIKTLQTAIDLAEKRGKKLQDQLDGLINKAAAAEREGKTAPEHLREDIESLQRQVKTNNDLIADHRKEEENVKISYDSDIARYTELKSTK